MPTHVNEITREVIGSAIEVHRCLGPGLLESAYRKCLARDFNVAVLKDGIRRRVLNLRE